MDILTYSLSKKYTEETVVGLGGFKRRSMYYSKYCRR